MLVSGRKWRFATTTDALGFAAGANRLAEAAWSFQVRMSIRGDL
jgi:hypothetical protein